MGVTRRDRRAGYLMMPLLTQAASMLVIALGPSGLLIYMFDLMERSRE